MNSDFQKLANTIMNFKDDSVEKFNKHLTPPNKEIDLSDDPDYKDIYGVWRTIDGIILMKKLKNGLYDYRGMIEYTEEQMKIMWEVLNAKA